MTSQEERKRLYYQVQDILLDETPVVFTHSDADVKVMGTKVRGFNSSMDGLLGNFQRLLVKP